MENSQRKERVFSTMHTFISVSRAHRAAIDKATASLELHRSQHKLLMFILQSQVEPSQKELCEHFGISAATVAISLKKLEKSGYVERTRLNNDNRINRIRLTEKGKRALEKTKALFDSFDEMAFENFTDEELDTLTELLNKMKTNIGKETVNEKVV